MTFRIIHVFLTAFILQGFITSSIHAKPLDEEMPDLIRSLAKQLLAKDKPKLVIMNFTDNQGRPNELGRFISERSSVAMVTTDGLTVVDRANIDTIKIEHQMSADGMLSPEDAKTLGQFTGADTILIGTLVSLDNTFSLTVKAISPDTSEVVAAGQMSFDATRDLHRMFGSKPTLSRTYTDIKTGSFTIEGEAIAVKELGTVTAVLRTVTLHNVGTSPRIRCTLDLYNRDLRHHVAIASNRNVVANNDWVAHPTPSGWRGQAVDSMDNTWSIPKDGLAGIASVYCFETSAAAGHSRVINPAIIYPA